MMSEGSFFFLFCFVLFCFLTMISVMALMVLVVMFKHTFNRAEQLF